MNAPQRIDPEADGRRVVSAAAWRRLERAATRPSRIVLMGEFSTGKSTLANLILGEDAAPTGALATDAPATWFAGGAPRIMAMDALGRELAADDPAAALLRRPGPRPAGCLWDLIDTRGLADPANAEDLLSPALARADAVVMLTLSTQAWRRSEMEAAAALPQRLRRRMILAVAAADRLTPDNLERVMGRMRVEADPAMRAILPLSAVKARRARAKGDDAGWRESGAADLFAAMDELAAEAAMERRAMLARYAPPHVDLPDELPEDLGEALNGDAAGAPAEAPGADAAASVENAERAPAAAAAPTVAGAGAGADDAAAASRDAPASVPAAAESAPPAAAAPAPQASRVLSAPVAVAPSRPAPQRPETSALRDWSMREETVARNDIGELREVAGFIGACLVDSETGLMLATEGGVGFDLETAAAGNTVVVSAKLRGVRAMGLDDDIVDVLITLGGHYHLVRPLKARPTVFMYLAVDRASANLGMSRMMMRKVEGGLRV